MAEKFRASSRAALLAAVIGSCLAAVESAAAADSARQPPQPADGQGLEEVIVSAQKRDENLQKVPIAVSVFDDNFIRENRIDSFKDVVLRVPSFYADSVSRTQTSIAMRGAGSLEDSPGSDQGVGLFVDEIYIGENSGLDFDFFDIERIEVLRGPQGTLFGRNVVGGAVNVITRKPSADPLAMFEATYGRFGELDLRGVVSGPLASDWFGQIAFSSRSSDGYAENLTTGHRLEAEDQQNLRAKLRFNPNEDLDANLTLNYMRDKSYGIARKLTGDVPASLQEAADRDDTQQDMDGGYDRKTWGSTLRIDYKVPVGTITSISGYRFGDHVTSADLDGTPLEIAEFKLQHNRVRQLSQEVRLAGNAGAIDYVLGAYYLDIDLRRDEYLSVHGYPGSAFAEATPGTAAPEGRGQFINTRSYAGFGQGTYHITDALRLTAGGRYTQEKKAGDTYCRQDGVLCSEYDIAVSKTFQAFTPKLTLDYDITPMMLGYATIARGFKSGGFASDFPDAQSAGHPFEPEHAQSYEAGIKARWLDNRLQTNVTAYRVNYTDLQVRQINGASTIVGNAGKSRVNGAEIELVAQPVKGLDLFASYAYTDGKYESLVLEGADYSGNRLILTPLNAFSVGGSYTASLADAGTLTVRGDVLYKSKTFLDVSNDPALTASYDGVVNLSTTYAFPNSKWEISLFGKNITNVRTSVTAQDYSAFFLSADELAAGKKVVATSYNQPATYGVTVLWKY
jgi:iron complex outermembrane receptor protein